MTTTGESGSAFRSVLRNRQFTRVLASDAISGAGDVLYWIALVVLLLERDSGGALVAIAVVVRLVPRVAFGAPGGVIADRYDRRRLLMLLDGSRALLMFTLAGLAAFDGPSAAMLVVVFLVCTLGTPYRPALSSGYPLLLPESDLAAANALTSSLFHVTSLTGPLIGAAVLALGEPHWAFVTNGLTFAVAVALMAGVTGLGTARGAASSGAGGSWTAELVEGARSVRSQRSVAALVAVIGLAALVRGLEMVLHVQVADAQLDLGASGYGLISAAMGAGAIAAVPFTSRLAASRHPGAIVVVSSLIGCASLALLAATEILPVALAVLAVEGASIVCFEVLALTMLQRVCRIDVLGRVLGLQNTFSGSTKLVGSLVAPVLVAASGVSSALVLGAVIAAIPTAAIAPRILAAAREAASMRDVLTPIVEALRRLRVFEGASRPVLERLAMRMVVEEIRAGTVVMREGDAADDFYVVRDGRLSVSASGVLINELDPDDWFGEIGLLRRTARTATVVADTDVVVWRMDGASFISAVTAAPTLPDALRDDMDVRLARSDAAAARAADRG